MQLGPHTTLSYLQINMQRYIHDSGELHCTALHTVPALLEFKGGLDFLFKAYE
jgi:hypothetical protein